jgi:SAM-dependent methyltransferase
MMLKELFSKYHSDKGDIGYDKVYESLFSPYKDLPITLLELGTYSGGSLHAWHDYFTQATIVGIDNNVEPLDLPDRVYFYRGDQQDREFIKGLTNLYKFDIVIDDAGHYWGPQQASFRYLWPHLNKGGIYVIEDLGTSFDHRYESPSTAPTVDYFAAKIPAIVADVYRDQQDIDSITFLSNMVVVRKRP